MSRPGRRRSEDDLRAAFAAKATQAPKADDVVRAVRQATRPRPSRLRWLLPVVAAAAAVAVAVPIALSVSDSNDKKASAPERAAGGADARTRYAAPSGASAPPGAATSTQALVPKAPSAMGASSAVCRPQDVAATLTVRQQGNAMSATLSITTRSGPCTIARIPSLRWGSLTARPAAPDARTSRAVGQLARGGTAIADVRWDATCMAPPGSVRADWGAGYVDVRAGATPQAKCEQLVAPSNLRIGAFTGLS